MARADVQRPRSWRVVAGMEAPVSTENWTEERTRIVKLLKAIESGKITHVDEEDLRQLQPTSEDNIAVLRARLAQLDARLGTTIKSQTKN